MYETKLPSVPIYVMLFRRIYAVAPIGLALYTTISEIDSAVKQLAITRASPDNMVHALYMEVINMNENSEQVGYGYYSCDQPVRYPTVSVSCVVTLANKLSYRAILITWIVYFSILLLYHWYQSCKYAVNDLRYYIALLQSNGTRFNQYFVKVGFLFTLCTVIVALVLAIRNPVTFNGNNIQMILLFGAINSFLLKPFLDVPYPALTTLVIGQEFPRAIHLQNVPPPQDLSLFNLYGTVISCEKVFTTLLRFLLLNKTDPSYNHLLMCGDSNEIERALTVICLDPLRDLKKASSELEQFLINSDEK